MHTRVYYVFSIRLRLLHVINVLAAIVSLLRLRYNCARERLHKYAPRNALKTTPQVDQLYNTPPTLVLLTICIRASFQRLIIHSDGRSSVIGKGSLLLSSYTIVSFNVVVFLFFLALP